MAMGTDAYTVLIDFVENSTTIQTIKYCKKESNQKAQVKCAIDLDRCNCITSNKI